jgi:2-polyprenyl-3-methyl-5-hydroxy-6-metoxy-1,4-benzoquinol methylase
LQYKTSNPIDIFGMKSNIVTNYEVFVRAMRREALSIAESSLSPATCPICESEQSTLAMVVHGLRWRHCTGCTHVYHNEAISMDRLEQLYTDVTGEFPYSHIYSEDPAIQKIRLESAATRKVDYISSFLQKDDGSRTARWLDIACGNGDVLGVAKSRGYDVMGIELSGELVKVARASHGIPVYEGTLPAYCSENPDEKFDVLGFIGILDALPNAMEYLRLAAEMANPSALIVINVPHVNSISGAIAGSFPAQAVRFAFPNQFHLFTEQSLQTALRNSGFEPIAAWYYGMDIYELINTISYDSPQFRTSKARDILVGLVNELQQVIDAARLSDEVLMIGRKTS